MQSGEAGEVGDQRVRISRVVTHPAGAIHRWRRRLLLLLLAKDKAHMVVPGQGSAHLHGRTLTLAHPPLSDPCLALPLSCCGLGGSKVQGCCGDNGLAQRGTVSAAGSLACFSAMIRCDRTLSMDSGQR